jgi:hypothetical protein
LFAAFLSSVAAAQAIPATVKAVWESKAAVSQSSEVSLEKNEQTAFIAIQPKTVVTPVIDVVDVKGNAVMPRGSRLIASEISWGKFKGYRAWCEGSRQEGHEFNRCLASSVDQSKATFAFRSYNPRGAFFFGTNVPNLVGLPAPVSLVAVEPLEAETLTLHLKWEKFSKKRQSYSLDLCYTDYQIGFAMKNVATRRLTEPSCVAGGIELSSTHPTTELFGGKIQFVDGYGGPLKLRVSSPASGRPFVLHGLGF